ncbi:MAG: CPXCG motif-containing cysteine-rich protein [Tahibacter sp.]
MLEFIVLDCPYCGESFETGVDLSGGSQHYVEDCAICCRPIEVRLRVSDDGELLSVDGTTDRD